MPTWMFILLALAFSWVGMHVVRNVTGAMHGLAAEASLAASDAPRATR